MRNDDLDASIAFDAAWEDESEHLPTDDEGPEPGICQECHADLWFDQHEDWCSLYRVGR